MSISPVNSNISFTGFLPTKKTDDTKPQTYIQTDDITSITPKRANIKDSSKFDSEIKMKDGSTYMLQLHPDTLAAFLNKQADFDTDALKTYKLPDDAIEE